MGMTLLAAGLLVFALLHFATAVPPLRSAFVARLGEKPYKGLFALLSLAAFVVAVHGYIAADYTGYWMPSAPLVLIHTFVLMPLAFIFIVSSYLSKGAKRLTRHPMLFGVALASFGHVMVNGDRASILLFGGIGLYCVLAILWSDMQTRRHDRAKWDELAQRTRHMPFVGLVADYAKPLPGLGLVAPIVGLVLYGLLLVSHGQLFGVLPLASVAG